MTRVIRSRHAVSPLIAVLALSLFSFGPASRPTAQDCPAGYTLVQPGAEPDQPYSEEADAPKDEQDQPAVCLNNKHPESLEDLGALAAQRAAPAIAPYGGVPDHAFTNALLERNRLFAQGQDPVNSHAWQPIGSGPLQSADAGYGQVNALGFVNLAGRITSFTYVPPSDRFLPDTLLASVSYGGVWATDASVTRWVSIGDSLPDQVVGAVGYTPYGGGTIIALTGDGSFGADSREGAGAFYTTDFGQHWVHSSGLPDEAFGFKIAVDKVHPNVLYAATGSGLYRSADGGHSFANVNLPTGPCAGKSNRVRPCLLANAVTDVVTMSPGGVSGEKVSKVLAAVGWRGGNVKNADGTVQSPNNGLYESDSGKTGSFKKLAATGFVPQARIGRVELGEATGPDQDHNFVYALVQDAVLIRKGLPGIDAPGFDFNKNCNAVKDALPALPLGLPPCQMPTVLNGVYVSRDWGQTWTLMADANELEAPGTGSALTPGNALLGSYGPGVQSWYNEWIKPDPSMADPVTGAPTRLAFGLEEVWENVNDNIPQIGPSAFHVIGRYYSGTQCAAILLQNLPACPTNGAEALLTETTTHPDQHDGIFIPTPEGVTLVVGNDGGVYKQVANGGTAGQPDFNNAGWGGGANQGFNTLLPYDAARAKDGTVWMGLQDNGVAKITDIVKKGRVVQRGRVIATKGGDGFFVAVDPNNSNTAYGEYVYGAMSATTDGGKTWTDMNPPITNGQFSNPFVMDPLDPLHLMTAGRQVVETGSGPGTGRDDWVKLFDLGTEFHRGSSTVEPGPTDPANQMTALDLVGPDAYVGFCGTCDVLNAHTPFQNGIATNVGGSKRPARYSTSGWHFARAQGLPNRYITSVAVDPHDPKTVYVALGGYERPWTPPGTLDARRAIGGHLYVSHDAGDHFSDVSGNLPDTPVNWVTLRGEQAIVATDIGVYVSKEGAACDADCTFQLLGRGLPMAPVYTARLTPGDPNALVVATYGRGAWLYRFGPTPPQTITTAPKLPTPSFLNKLIASFDFDTSDQGWTARSSDSLEGWKRQAPGSGSAQSFQVVPYTNDATATLASPKMAVPARSLIKVQWDERRDTEPCCDFLIMDWSSDGHLWHSVRAIDGQNPDFPQFTTVSVSFVAPAGSLYLRFRLNSDQLVSSPPYTGVAVDNIMIKR